MSPLAQVTPLDQLRAAMRGAIPRRVRPGSRSARQGCECLPYPQTPDTALAWIRAHGLSVVGLARSAGIARTVLSDLLRGQLRGHRGQAHLGAIVLGLKPDPEARP